MTMSILVTMILIVLKLRGFSHLEDAPIWVLFIPVMITAGSMVLSWLIIHVIVFFYRDVDDEF